MDQSLWNAYVLYKKQNPTQTIKLLEFCLKIIEESIEKYSNTDKSGCPERPNSTLNSLRLTARHFTSHIPPNPVKREPQRQCAVSCLRKEANGKKIHKETQIWCRDCEVGLCLKPCLKLYHTKLHF